MMVIDKLRTTQPIKMFPYAKTATQPSVVRPEKSLV
jgi:hypothetical protein